MQVEEVIVYLNAGALHPAGVAGLTELTTALAWRTSSAERSPPPLSATNGVTNLRCTLISCVEVLASLAQLRRPYRLSSGRARTTDSLSDKLAAATASSWYQPPTAIGT